MITYHDRVMKLRAKKKRMGFSFRFEDLFSEEELLNMTVAQRKTAEKKFIREIDNMHDVRMPFSSQDGFKNKLYNLEYQYNEVKKNFKVV